MSFKRLFLFAAFVLAFLTAANSFSINNFEFKPSLQSYAGASNNKSSIYNGENYSLAYLFINAPLQYSFDVIPAALYAEPYFKTYYSKAFEEDQKLAFANAFLLLNFGDYSLKLGRQYYADSDTNFAVYFGPDDNYDFSFPSYIDGAAFSFGGDILSYDIILGKTEDLTGGFKLDISPYAFWKISLFSYFTKLPKEETLYLFGAGTRLNLTSKLSAAAYFAFNAGKEEYQMFNNSFEKKYNGYFLGVNAEADLSSDSLSTLLFLNWAFSSPSDSSSEPFTPISAYNIYGDIAGGQKLFSNAIQALSFGVNISPQAMPRLNLDFEIFYYSSSFKDSFNQYIGSEVNLSAAYAFEDFSLKLNYAYFYSDTGFLEEASLSSYDINKYIHMLGLYLCIDKLF